MDDLHKRITKKPMDSESLYRQVFDMAMDGISIIDEDGIYIDTNQAYCQMLGFSYDEIVGTHAEDFIIPEERYKLEEEYIPKIRKMGRVRLDSVIVRKDGTPVPVEVSGVRFSHAGKPSFLSIIHDLRERKEKEAELAASEERYRILTQNVTDGVIVVQEGELKFVNNAFVSLFGSESTEGVVGKGLEVLSCQDLQKYFEKEGEALIKGDLSESIFVAYCSNGDGREFWVEARDKKITWEGRPAILATLRDVTESRLRQIAIEEEKEDLFRENITLRSTMKDRFRLGDIVGKSPAMHKIYDLILKASASDVGVAIYGESGTGKELIARNIHQMSARSAKSFVPVNCGAIPETLFESEFFGHRKGSFTGAHRDKDGFFDLAQGGTLFLDEVGELSTGNQVKLLRAIDGGGYRPVGGDKVRETNVRIIVATNRNLSEMIKKGLMREDFFYRIHIIPISVPPLREHKDDIPLLVDYFLEGFGEERKIETLPVKILEAMYNYEWPGNIRELENVLQRYNTLGRIDFLDVSETQPVESTDLLSEFENGVGLREVMGVLEKQYLVRILDQNRWHKGKTATVLQLPAKTLYRKMKKYQLL
jgi:PAS domain S-box-containing protein